MYLDIPDVWQHFLALVDYVKASLKMIMFMQNLRGNEKKQIIKFVVFSGTIQGHFFPLFRLKFQANTYLTMSFW
jgi:glycerol-3-phosphate acyltransferase PlsY